MITAPTRQFKAKFSFDLLEQSTSLKTSATYTFTAVHIILTIFVPVTMYWKTSWKHSTKKTFFATLQILFKTINNQIFWVAQNINTRLFEYDKGLQTLNKAGRKIVKEPWLPNLSPITKKRFICSKFDKNIHLEWHNDSSRTKSTTCNYMWSFVGHFTNQKWDVWRKLKLMVADFLKDTCFYNDN